MQMVSTWNFKALQSTIVPVIEHLIDNETVSNHQFTQRWTNARITTNSTFQTVATHLAIKDILEYRHFLMTAPDITHVIFGHPNDTGTGFQYYIKPIPPSKENTSAESTTLITKTEIVDNAKEIDLTMNQPSTTDHQELTDASITTNGTTHKICYGTNEDFQDMFSLFWPFFMRFVSNCSDHDYTKQLQKWIDNGLKDATDLNMFKKIVGVNNLDQLYVVLRDSPALNTHFDIQWDHKIMYRMKETQVDEPNLTGDVAVHKKYTVKSCKDRHSGME
jgi:hypothetical protein